MFWTLIRIEGFLVVTWRWSFCSLPPWSPLHRYSTPKRGLWRPNGRCLETQLWRGGSKPATQTRRVFFYDWKSPAPGLKTQQEGVVTVEAGVAASPGFLGSWGWAGTSLGGWFTGLPWLDGIIWRGSGAVGLLLPSPWQEAVAPHLETRDGVQLNPSHVNGRKQVTQRQPRPRSRSGEAQTRLRASIMRTLLFGVSPSLCGPDFNERVPLGLKTRRCNYGRAVESSHAAAAAGLFPPRFYTVSQKRRKKKKKGHFRSETADSPLHLRPRSDGWRQKSRSII